MHSLARLYEFKRRLAHETVKDTVAVIIQRAGRFERYALIVDIPTTTSSTEMFEFGVFAALDFLHSAGRDGTVTDVLLAHFQERHHDQAQVSLHALSRNKG